MTTDIFNKIYNRQTVKVYSDQKISEKDWKIIKKTIKWAPSSHGLEPYRVLIINKDHPLRKAIWPLALKQKAITSADKLVVFIAKKRETFANKKWLTEKTLRLATQVAGEKGEKAQTQANNQVAVILSEALAPSKEQGDDYAIKQTYIALGMAVTSAALLGIGSTPIGGFSRPNVNELLHKEKLLESDETVAILLAFGYPESETAYAHYGSGKRVRDDDEYKFTEI